VAEECCNNPLEFSIPKGKSRRFGGLRYQTDLVPNLAIFPGARPPVWLMRKHYESARMFQEVKNAKRIGKSFRRAYKAR
jgi:hypothetical protein